MPLPHQIREEVENLLSAYCDKRVPPEVRNKLRVGFQIRGNSVTLFEERPHFQDRTKLIEIVVAQFRYNPMSSRWILYCADRNSRWHEYLEIEPSRSIEDLLREVDRDPTGIFWG